MGRVYGRGVAEPHRCAGFYPEKTIHPTEEDEAFLAPATPRTQALMHKLQGLMKLEQEFGGVLDVDTQTVSSLLNTSRAIWTKTTS